MCPASPVRRTYVRINCISTHTGSIPGASLCLPRQQGHRKRSGQSGNGQTTLWPVFKIIILFNFSALQVMHLASTSDLSVAGYTAITLGATSTASHTLSAGIKGTNA